MSDLYTLCSKDGRGDLTVIAAGQTAADAIMLIAGDGGTFRAFVSQVDYASAGFRCFEFRRARQASPCGIDTYIISATVPLTEDASADKAAAMAMIEAQVLSNHRCYWKGVVFTDNEYAEKLSSDAERKRINDLDRTVTYDVMSALISAGFAIEANVLDDVPEYKRSKNASRVTDHLLEFEMAEVIARRGTERAWLRFIFGEAGWDALADYSDSISEIVEPVIEPHLPWNKPGYDGRDRGYDVYVVPSPATASPAEIEGFFDLLTTRLSGGVG